MAALGVLVGLFFAAPAIAASPAPSPVVSLMPSAQPSPAPTSWFATPVPSPAPLGGNPDLPILSYLIQLAVVTALVAVLGYASLKFTRGKLPGRLGLGLGLGAQRQIRILDRAAVDPKRLVFLVGVGKRYFLVAATESSATPIAELSQEDLGDFAQTLEQEKLRGETL